MMIEKLNKEAKIYGQEKSILPSAEKVKLLQDPLYRFKTSLKDAEFNENTVYDYLYMNKEEWIKKYRKGTPEYEKLMEKEAREEYEDILYEYERKKTEKEELMAIFDLDNELPQSPTRINTISKNKIKNLLYGHPERNNEVDLSALLEDNGTPLGYLHDVHPSDTDHFKTDTDQTDAEFHDNKEQILKEYLEKMTPE